MAERIEIDYDYAVCAWARHFNVSQERVKEAVAAVGNSADKVREHLSRNGPESRNTGGERPSGR